MSERRGAMPAAMMGEAEEADSDVEEEIIGESESSEEEEEVDSSSEEEEAEEEEATEAEEMTSSKAKAKAKARKDAVVVNGKSTRRPRAPAGKKSGQQARKLVGDEEVRFEGDASSDEEHERNTIGNVPLHWYDEFDHIGYDKAGKKLMRKEGMDEVDKVLAAKDDPFYRRTVYDAKNDTSTVLTDRELIMVRRMLESKFPEAGMDAEPDYNDYFTREKMITPLHSTYEPKRRFLPSKWERMKVMKLVRGIREGRITMGAKPPSKKPEFYLMWGADDHVEDPIKRRKAPKHIPAPKVKPPAHRESYHPPQEYLPTEAEAEAWLKAHPDDRKINYLPTDFGSLRKVRGYDNFIRERYERCLDLYMCPRTSERRLNIDPESLVPRLPKPSELRPYPTTTAVTYFGHNGRVRAMDVSPTGELLATGGDDQIVRIWEVDTGRCLASYNLASNKLDRPKAHAPKVVDADKEGKEGDENGKAEGDEEAAKPEEPEEPEEPEGVEAKPPIVAMAWNPQPRYKVLAVAIASRVVLINAGACTAWSPEDAEETHKLLSGALEEEAKGDDDEEEEDEEEEEEEEDDDEEDGEEDGDKKEKKVGDGEAKGGAPEGAQEDEDPDATEARKRAQALKKSRGIAAWLEEGEATSASALMEGGFCKTTILYKDKESTDIKQLVWHAKGEYLATVRQTTKRAGQVTIHHVPKRLSQQPFRQGKNQQAQCVLFHPRKPILFMATKRRVAVYQLIQQRCIQVLRSEIKWISSLALHPDGDNLVVGSYDRRVAWFDMDMGSKPWKVFKYHRRAVRKVRFHPRFPLMASAADDGVVHIFHARVFDDFNKDPFLVPVKILKGHTPTLDGLGVLDLVFHPTQPWVFSAGADGRVQLYQNLP